MWRIFAILLMPALAQAGPGPATRYLMNERATLLDIGMMRLETLTHEFQGRVGLDWTDKGSPKFFRAGINTLYDPKDDKIYVHFLVMNSDATAEQMAEGCKNAMGQMSTWLLKSLPRLFLHTGYDDPLVPVSLPKELAAMFELRCYFSSARDTSEGRFWASQSLGDVEMKIGKWKTTN